MTIATFADQGIEFADVLTKVAQSDHAGRGKMGHATNTIYLKDYTPPSYLVDKVELTFQLSPTQTRVLSKIWFTPNPATTERHFYLHGVDLTFVSAHVDGTPVTPTPSGEGIICPVPDAPFLWEAEVVISPATNTALEGLYMSNGMYCTQCEAEGFRKITYYPDRPDVLAPFRVRIEGDLPVLLSNGNLVGQGDGWVEWDDPWPKPAYLFALVAGDLINHPDRFVTRSGRDVELNIWVRDGDQDKCDFSMRALKASMDWDERVYGREYDLDVFNIVAVDDFNMGAMENKGLNIFNSSYVLAHPDITTDDNFELIEAVIAHEYFHNWTGNRVTCRDWFQLCLKEGLTVFRDAQFTADMRSAPVKCITDAVVMRNYQFREDAGPLAHPVRPESFVEINNFYTGTVYQKGAQVISMLKTLVGDAAYYDAVTLYFDRHDGQAATIEDWIKAFEDTTGRDLSQFMRWYSQAGTPKVQIDEHFADGTLTLRMRQTIPDTPGQTNKAPHVIPIAVGLLAADGTEVMPTKVCELTQADQSFAFSGFPERPVPSVLRHFSAPVLIDMAQDDARLGFLLAHDTDPFARWDAGQTLMRNVLTRMITTGAPCDDGLLHGLRNSLLNSDLDPAVRAYLIGAPALDAMARHLSGLGHAVDPMAIHQAVDRLYTDLARVMGDDLETLYHAHAITAPFEPNAAQAAARALRAKVMGLMTRLDGGVMAQTQFDRADNMTDTLSALKCLISAGTADTALDRFEHQWSHERLAMDRWFAAQITAAKPQHVVHVTHTLMAHPQFTLGNPNRARAVLVNMFQHFAGFHHPTHDGYATLADAIIAIDPSNPQLAARICNGFSAWAMMDADRQAKIITQIDRVLAQPNLSPDATEMLTRIKG